MADGTLRVLFDDNDARWTSQRTYIDHVARHLDSHPAVERVSSVSEADVVHLNYLNPLGRLIEGKESRTLHFRRLLNSALSETKVIVTEHGGSQFFERDADIYFTSKPVSETSNLVKRTSSRAVARLADAVIAISPLVKRCLVDAGIPSEKIHVVEHGVSEEFRSGSETDDEGYVLHVSKFSPHKNPDAIVDLAHRIDAQFVIVGTGWEDAIGKQVSTLDNVKLTGYVSKERLLNLYNKASVFYFPSKYESFGLPILEAAASGTVPVASKFAGAAEICDQTYQVHPDDITKHVELVQQLLDTQDIRRKREKAVRETASEYSWGKTAKKNVGIYKQEFC